MPPADPEAAADPSAPPPSTEPTLAPNERPGSWWGRGLAALFAVTAIGFWFWLILLAPEQEPRDRLDDPAFAAAAEPICAAAQDAVAALPPARESATPEQRAVVLEQATAELQAMVDDLRAVAPTAGRDGEILAEWLDDWEVYLGDRSDYAAELAAGEDVPFTLTPKAGDAVTEAIDGLAAANDLESCTTPLDV